MSAALHYQQNLAGEAVAISDGVPKVGYYKLRKFRGGPYLPVCIFMHEGEMVCRVGNDMASVSETWLFCAGNPVPKADALFAFDNGKWPGDAPEPILSNNPPSDDPLEEITRKLEAESQRVDAWIAENHEGATAANFASNWLDQIRKLEKETVAAFDTEKAPILAEQKRVDAKWRGPKALADALKRKMDACFQSIGRKEKARLQAIADAKAREEAEARRKAWEEEQAKIAALAQEHNIAVEPEAPPPLEIIVPKVKVAFGGAQASRNAVRAVPATAVVEDWEKAAIYFINNAKLKELVQRLVDHAVKDGHTVPGVKVIPGE